MPRLIIVAAIIPMALSGCAVGRLAPDPYVDSATRYQRPQATHAAARENPRRGGLIEAARRSAQSPTGGAIAQASAELTGSSQCARQPVAATGHQIPTGRNHPAGSAAPPVRRGEAPRPIERFDASRIDSR